MVKVSRKGWLLIGGGFCLFLLLAPFLLRGYWIRLLTNMFMFGILAESVNIIAGYCGYLALGNMLFFGLGAYIVAVLMTKFAFSFALALIIAGLGASLFSAIVGLPILRLKGQYFIMATMALMELLRAITNNIPITGGGQGITLPIFPGGAAAANFFFYYFMFGLMVFAILCTFYISKSRLGYAFRAIRFDEDAASVMGINPTPYKTIAWAISAFFTGLTGGTYAYWMSYIDPGEAYQIMPSIKMYLMMVLGGRGTVLGPITGAFFIEFISELVWGKFLELHFLILGLILVLVVIFTPKGFMDLLRRGLSFSKLMAGVKENRV
ncbi:MAG: branched-chain amino acid ABC transporter permease [Thermodesulfobacteriota bacterium]|nr:branched-chain amino acid ABC transporter permease [Thermodesulfobacteriota bacterium]